MIAALIGNTGYSCTPFPVFNHNHNKALETQSFKTQN